MVNGEDRLEAVPVGTDSQGEVEKVTTGVRGEKTKRLEFCSFLLPQGICSVFHWSLVIVH